MFNVVVRRVRGLDRRASFRNLALLGTALGCSLAGATQAEKVIFNGSGDFSATRADTLTDTAQVVDARTTAGNITLNFSGINVSNDSGSQGSGIFGQVAGAGDISITSGTLTASGNTAIYGVDARAASGNIAITAGTTTANNTVDSRGIYAITAGGNITIAATTTDGGQRAIFTGSNGAFPNLVTIDSGTATANGTGSPNAIVGQGTTVNITSGTASLSNAAASFGAAIFVNADTTTVKSTTVNVAAMNSAGIQTISDLGTSSIDSGTVTASQSATGINVTQSGGSMAIKSGTITLGGANSQGIFVSTTSADATSINSGTITGSASSTGIQVSQRAGPVTITSDTINFTGTGTTGIAVGGGEGSTGALTITSNKINVNRGSAISFDPGTGTGDTVTIASTAITGTAFGGGAISVNNSAGIAVTSGSIAQSITVGNVNSLQGSGINVVASGTQAATVNSGSIAFTGAGNSTGIALQATGGGTGTITSGSVSVIGNGGYGILASSVGAIAITSGDVTTTGTTRFVAGDMTLPRYADGIDAIAGSGAITVLSTGTVSTAGANATGINVEAGRAITTFGTPTTDASTAAISVTNSGTVKTTGAGSTGIDVNADDNAVTLTSANVSTTGANAIGINVSGGAGALNITTGNVTTTGATSDAVHIVSASGPITATVNGTLSAANGTGLFIDPPSAVTVNVAAGASVNGSTSGLSVVGAANGITNLGTIASTGVGPAIVASGATSLDNSGTITAGTGGVAVQLGATNDVVTLRTGSSVAGSIAGGGGTDAAILAGTATAATPTQTIASFTGFDSLTVAGGYWTVGTTGSTFNSATIAAGAALEVANTGAGFSGLTVPNFADNGTLVIRSTTAATGSTLGATTVTGTGGVLFTGGGTATLDGVNSISATNTIGIANGATVILTGTQSGPVATQAGGTFQLGNGGTTGTFTGSLADNGTFVYNRSDDYALNGAITGAGTIVKNGAGKLTFGTGFAFTGTTTINGGSIKLSTPVAANTELDVRGLGTLDLSGTVQTVAELAGNSSAASVNIAGGSLTANQATSSAFAGNLTGAGSFTKAGTGRLNFTGDNTYTGPTAIDGGTLSVNGSIVSPVTVNMGGTLGGIGRVASVTIGAGGTFAPGNSIGTINVAGPVSFAAGSTFQVEANGAGGSDRIIASGVVTIGGGTVAVRPDATTAYGKMTTYNIVAASAVNGTFTGATSSQASLIPILSYTPTGVNLLLANAALSFGGIAVSANQLATANAVQARGQGNAVFTAVLFQPTAAGGQAAFDNLSGEVFASLPTVLVDEGRRVREAVLDRASVAYDGYGIWGTGLLNTANARSDAGIAAVDTDRKGVVSGIDFGRDGWRVGAAAGYIKSDIDINARASSARVDSKLVSIYGGWTGGRWAVQAGGSYTWHDIDTTRAVAVGTLAGTERASFNGHSSQGFAEISYGAIQGGAFTMAPFAGYAHVRTHTDGFAEGGNAAALTLAADTRNTDFATVGIKVGGTQAISSTATFLPHLRVAYQRTWGDRSGTTSATFGGTGTAFGVTGAALGRNSYSLNGGFDIAFGERFRIGTGAYALAGGGWSDYGGKLTIGFDF